MTAKAPQVLQMAPPSDAILQKQPAPPPMFANAANKPKAKSMTPSFLGAGSLPQPGQAPQKTLLGQ